MTQSSYLMSFIHGLLENSSKELRERKRRILERDYTETEEVLNVYLNEKYDEVTKVLNIYRDVSENLEINRKAVQKMKRDIEHCKSLLSFNRHELRRLWLELVEQRRSLELIEILDRVKMAPEILKNLITAKAWPEATEYLLKINEIMAKEVDHVPALIALKAELAAKKKVLTDEMRATLFFLVFNQPIALVISNKNIPYSSAAEMQYAPLLSPGIAECLPDFCPSDQRSQSIDSVTSFDGLPLSDWRLLPSDPPEIDSSLFKNPQAVAGSLLAKHLSGDPFSSSKDAKSRTAHHLHSGANRTPENMDRMITDKKQWAETIVALTHCLHRLQKLSQAFHSLRVKVQSNEGATDSPGPSLSKSSRNSNEIFVPGRGLMAEIHTSITLPAVAEIERTLAAQGETSRPLSLADPTYLVEMLQLLFPALCMHFNAFMLVLNTTRKIKEQNPSVSFQFLDVLSEEHIWGYIQAEVQTVLSSHLSNQQPRLDSTLPMIQNYVDPTSVATAASPTFNSNKLDLNALMGKRKSGLPAFLSGVTSDSIGSSSSQNSGSADGPSTTSNTELFFSFSKTARSQNLNSYLRENRIQMPIELPSVDSMGSRPSKAETIQMEVISSYPIVCRPSADNVKSIYSLVLNFASLIEMQAISAQSAIQRALSNDGEIMPKPATADSDRRALLAPPLRLNKVNISQGLKGAIFAIGAQKMLPKSNGAGYFEFPIKMKSVMYWDGDGELKVRCQLRVFLLSFISRLYLPNAEVELRQPLARAVSGPDALTAIISQQTQRVLGLQRPILTVAYLTDHALSETKGMAIALLDYYINCATIGLSILETFITWASSVYKSISVSEIKGAPIPSAEWARDKDLSRFWTNFPVWQRMMAADAFATASAAHTVSNLHDPQLGSGVNIPKSSIFSNLHELPSVPGSSLSSGAGIVFGLLNLGLTGRRDSALTGASSLQAIPFAKPVEQDSTAEADVTGRNGGGTASTNIRVSKQENIPLHERETTRLAVKEMDNLLDIIRDEVGSGTDLCLPTAGMLTIKNMGRLRESVHWLERCVHNWLGWLECSLSAHDMEPFTTAAEELTFLSDATLLTVYLDVRVQTYNLFGNLSRTANFWCPVDEVDVDAEVTRCLVYWDQLHEVLVHSFCPHEIRFIFDELGNFISQIFLRLIPQITRMNVNGNRKMCRNIYKLQQALALLTENHESDLIRVKQLYELFYLTPEAVVNRVIEQGVAFGVGVYQDLLRLYQRSHPSHDYSRTDDSITKLAHIIRA